MVENIEENSKIFHVVLDNEKLMLMIDIFLILRTRIL